MLGNEQRKELFDAIREVNKISKDINIDYKKFINDINIENKNFIVNQNQLYVRQEKQHCEYLKEQSEKQQKQYEYTVNKLHNQLVEQQKEFKQCLIKHREDSLI